MGIKRGLIGALLALLAICEVADAQPRVPKGFYGITSQTLLENADYRAIGKGGVGALRTAFPWSEVDPPPTYGADIYSPRAYRWNLIDPTVRKAAKRGIRVLPTIYGTPHWVAQYQDCPSNCHKLGPNTLEAYIAFYMFMRAATGRYGPGGDFWRQYPQLPYRPIRAWQIWNEQNSSDFWKPAPNVDDYATLFAAGAEAVKSVDPGARAILGGMIGEPGQEGKSTISGWNFLSQLLQRPRVSAVLDGLAVHPYGANMRQIRGTIGRWREELRKVGAPNMKIYVTELGWASGGPPHGLNLGLRGQARMLNRALRFFTEKREQFHFAQVVIYSWRDGEPGAINCSWCLRSGLVHYDGRLPKPAWDVFRKWAGGQPPR